MNDKTNWWMIIGITIIVAVMASLATVKLIGDVIRLNSNTFGRYEVYTKGEIDAKLIDTTTNLKVLNMLSVCSVVNVGVPAPIGIVQTGDYVCSIFGKKCIHNFIGFDPQLTVSGNTNKISQPISCSDATNNYPNSSWARTTCCSDTQSSSSGGSSSSSSSGGTSSSSSSSGGPIPINSS